MMGVFSDFLLAKTIRRIDSSDSSLNPIYLTFDDGPTDHSTSMILDLLDEEKVKASFFCIANKALKTPSLFNEIVSAGHSIGNHSLDHTFHNFFLGKRKMFNWINESEQVFSKILNESTVGFRS
ncbi:MAG: polysaccharide deacetylase family protein, partial [Proteobacteria bacterium]|nr:polysaccharide deacetylase family protein [Pseudomonadota bacterium]